MQECHGPPDLERDVSRLKLLKDFEKLFRAFKRQRNVQNSLSTSNCLPEISQTVLTKFAVKK